METRKLARRVYEYGGGGNVHMNAVSQAIERGERIPPTALHHALAQIDEYLSWPDGTRLSGLLGGQVDHAELRQIRALLRSRRGKGGGGAAATPLRRQARPRIPKVITHQNMQPLLDAIDADPYFTPEGYAAKVSRPAWVDTSVTLEFPLGELARGGVHTIALVGRARPETVALTGKEGFDAQGLEGKVRVRKPLFNALMNLRDLLLPRRGRILVD